MSDRLGNALKWIKNNQATVQKVADDQRERDRLTIRSSHKLRYALDPRLRIKSKWQSRANWYFSNGLRDDKPTRFGCLYSEFLSHIESLFRHGMIWDNHGTLWELDHIVSCARFNLPREIASCFHYTNLRPRILAINRIEGRKVGNGVFPTRWQGRRLSV